MSGKENQMQNNVLRVNDMDGKKRRKKMLEIDLENKTIKGTAKVKDIKEKGLIEASIENE